VLVLVEGVFTDLDQVIVLFLYYLLKDFVWEFDFNFLFKVVFEDHGLGSLEFLRSFPNSFLDCQNTSIGGLGESFACVGQLLFDLFEG